MKTALIFNFFFLILFSACTTHKMHGLWMVEKVIVGKEEMTPIKRWVKLNKDFCQKSGNGWSQHSVGTWEFDKKSNELNIVNINGFMDTNDPFKVKIEKDKMYWNRKEEGQMVNVFFKKINELPSSPGDQLLGVWDLTKATEKNKDITKEYDPENKRYLFLRWDKIFTIQYSPKGRLDGVYHIHGHRPEIELIYYGENCERNRWAFEVYQDKLILNLMNTEKEIKLEYKRINYFPE